MNGKRPVLAKCFMKSREPKSTSLPSGPVPALGPVPVLALHPTSSTKCGLSQRELQGSTAQVTSVQKLENSTPPCRNFDIQTATTVLAFVLLESTTTK